MLSKITIVFVMSVAFFGYSSADECIACSSLNDIKCAQNPAILLPVKCNSNEKSSCYTRVVSGLTYRGCFNELDQAVRDVCLNDTLGQSCMICENVNGVKGCNNMIFPFNRLRCHTCAENGLMGNCFSGVDGNAVPCKTYSPDDKCYIRKTAKSITRDCLSETTKCTNPSHCFTCDGDGCNNLMGNNTAVPLAPNSASAWTSSIILMIFPAFMCLQRVV